MKFLMNFLAPPMAPVLAAVLLLTGSAAFAASEIHPFTSDGCSLFPDGTPDAHTRWCDCCYSHDLAYWQGGTKAERPAADEALRDCVEARTGDGVLALAMYLGVRAGGSPAFPAWYRWGYGWNYGRGYRKLSAAEKEQIERQLQTHANRQPQSYCREDPADRHEHPAAASALPSGHLESFYRLDAGSAGSAQPGISSP